MNRWQELGLTPDEAQDEIDDLTRENATLRRERDEAVAHAADLRRILTATDAEVERLRAALEEIRRRYHPDGLSISPWCHCAGCIAHAALEGKP